MISPAPTATRVDGGWRVFRENGDTDCFIGKRFVTAPKQQNEQAIFAAYVAMRLADTTNASNHQVIHRKAKQR